MTRLVVAEQNSLVSEPVNHMKLFRLQLWRFGEESVSYSEGNWQESFDWDKANIGLILGFEHPDPGQL